MTAQCYWREFKKHVTVGDVRQLVCEWPKGLKLQRPFKWELINPPHSYALVFLKTLVLKPHQAVLEVTSYHPGNYHLGLQLVHMGGELQFPPLKWQVDSVLSSPAAVGAKPGLKPLVRPYPPYGPWQEAWPVWFWPAGVLLILGMGYLLVYRLASFFKRRVWIQKKQGRGGGEAFRTLMSGLMRLERGGVGLSSFDFKNKLSNLFECFLEEEFLVPAVGVGSYKIIKYFKLYQPLLYQKHRLALALFLKELNSIGDFKLQDFEQLLNMARNLSIQLFSSAQAGLCAPVRRGGEKVYVQGGNK